jgi:hypothetical protein
VIQNWEGILILQAYMVQVRYSNAYKILSTMEVVPAPKDFNTHITCNMNHTSLPPFFMRMLSWLRL